MESHDSAYAASLVQLRTDSYTFPEASTSVSAQAQPFIEQTQVIRRLYIISSPFLDLRQSSELRQSPFPRASPERFDPLLTLTSPFPNHDPNHVDLDPRPHARVFLRPATGATAAGDLEDRRTTTISPFRCATQRCQWISYRFRCRWRTKSAV